MNRVPLRNTLIGYWLAAFAISGALASCTGGSFAGAAAPAPATVATFTPTVAATIAATIAPTVAATVEPTVAPTLTPTDFPTFDPTSVPTPVPTDTPAAAPTNTPVPVPTDTPVPAPTVAPTEPPPAAVSMRLPFVGLAIIGDSTQDEYRGSNPRGNEYVLTTLNWVELLAQLRGINLGPWESNPEPRREGLAYNWARSGATTANMIYTEQHTGVARQVAAGLVSHVVIQIGINDFDDREMGLKIYQGELGGPELNTFLDVAAVNIANAAQTVQDAGSVQVMIAATQDYVTIPIVPELYTQYDNPEGRQRLVAAFAALNAKLKAIAELKGIAYFDYNAAMSAAVNARFDGERYLNVGGELIDLRTRGNEPHFGLLDDEYVHPGTVVSGLSANVYIAEFNRVFGTEIALLSDEEILKAAGIR